MTDVTNHVADVFIEASTMDIQVTAPECPEVSIEALGARGEKGDKGDTGEGSAANFDPGDLTLHFDNHLL